jgi:hypothetical protein
VFLNCVADQSFDESGPHLHWDTGVLYDNVVDHGTAEKGHRTAGSLEARDRGLVDGSQQGWTGANVVFWNCTADQMDVERPPTAQNWAIGCTAKFTPTSNGFIESSNKPVQPQSLYKAQLADRLARFRSVSSLVRVTATSPVLGPSTTLFVTVTNVSNVFIPGPILIAFTNLPQGVHLTSVNGSPATGDLFVAAGLGGLAPGQSATALISVSGLLRLPPQGITAEILAEVPRSLSLPPPPLAGAAALAPAGTPDPVGGPALDPLPR